MYHNQALRMAGLVVAIVALLLPTGDLAYATDLSIKTRTKYYGFRAKKFRNIAKQMRRYGPSLRMHGRRVWAKAHREYDWHIDYHRHNGKCAAKRVKVRMKITYTLPRLINISRVSISFRTKWQRVFNTLRRHELVHGRNYRLLAKRLKAGLLRLAPQLRCSALRRAAKKLDNKLHRLDLNRNKRFESGERRRFTRLRHRIERG